MLIDKTQQSHYLEMADFALNLAKRAGSDAAEIHFVHSEGFSVTARAGDVETLEQSQEKHLSVTVYQNQKTGTANTVDLSENAIADTINRAAAIARYTSPDPFNGLADPETLSLHYPELDLYHHWNISPSDAIQLAIECETISRQQDPRIMIAEGASVATSNFFKIYANTLGFTGHYQASEHSIGCSAVAEENSQKQNEHEYTVARKAELLDDVAHVAKQAAYKALQRLGARKINTQRCPVIFHAPVARSLLAVFINAITGRNQYRKSSFLLDQINQPIFPDFIDIHQQPHLLGGLGSKPFDSDGVITSDRYYIKEGRLESYVLGSYSARKLGLKTTGNAGGVYNLTISHQDLNLSALLKKMDKGLLITELLGQGANILTGDYSRGAGGYWIENGEIQFPVEEITVSNNLKQMYKNIIAIGNDTETRGNIRTGSILIENMTVAGD